MTTFVWHIAARLQLRADRHVLTVWLLSSREGNRCFRLAGLLDYMTNAIELACCLFIIDDHDASLAFVKNLHLIVNSFLATAMFAPFVLRFITRSELICGHETFIGVLIDLLQFVPFKRGVALNLRCQVCRHKLLVWTSRWEGFNDARVVLFLLLVAFLLDHVQTGADLRLDFVSAIICNLVLSQWSRTDSHGGQPAGFISVLAHEWSVDLDA